ncbi:MAG: TolC family protein [Spirochaetes bacterium]|nr:TolC family protein [Spirochaetota bacterium]
MLKKFFLIIFILLIYKIKINSSENLELTVDKALDLVLKNNINVKLQKSIKNERLISLIAVFNKFYPESSYSGTLSKPQHLSGPEPDPLYKNSLSLSYGMTFSFNAKIIFDIYQTILDYNEGRINLEAVNKKMAMDVKKVYFFIILSEKKINLKKIEYENAKEKYNTSLNGYNRGEVSELDKLNAELAYKKLIPELLKMQNDYINQIKLFKAVLGLDDGINLILTEDLPDYSNVQLEKLKGIGLNDNLQLKLLLLDMDREKNLLYIAISAMTPTFRIGYSINSNFLLDPYLDRWFSSINDDWRNTQYFNLSLSIPLDPYFPLSGRQVDVIKDSFQIKRSKMEYDDYLKNKRIELDYKINKIKEILESLENLKFNIVIAEKAYKLTEIEYYNAQKTFLELKDAEKNLLQANIDYLNSKYELYTSIIDIENITNKDIKDFF